MAAPTHPAAPPARQAIAFRAKARTLDMLGRQQIAGIPTAISELFKNAHDAYASRVEIDFSAAISCSSFATTATA